MLYKSKEGKRQNAGRTASTRLTNVHQSYSHDGFSDVQKRLLYEFPDAVDLPRGYDKVLGFIILQHQPHGLEREAEPRESWTQRPLGKYHVTDAHHRTGPVLTGKPRHATTLRSSSECTLIPKVFRRLPTQGQGGKAFTEEK